MFFEKKKNNISIISNKNGYGLNLIQTKKSLLVQTSKKDHPPTKKNQKKK